MFPVKERYRPTRGFLVATASCGGFAIASASAQDGLASRPRRGFLRRANLPRPYQVALKQRLT
jgi:hypothetical protein